MVGRHAGASAPTEQRLIISVCSGPGYRRRPVERRGGEDLGRGPMGRAAAVAIATTSAWENRRCLPSAVHGTARAVALRRSQDSRTANSCAASAGGVQRQHTVRYRAASALVLEAFTSRAVDCLRVGCGVLLGVGVCPGVGVDRRTRVPGHDELRGDLPVVNTRTSSCVIRCNGGPFPIL
jgi:hypothetical protein